MKEENIIFIVSQPRSGSTYLQSLLSNNKDTNTCSEPWILLNYANQIKQELITAKFGNWVAVDAYNDYLSKYPDFDFKENQKQFLLSLYEPMYEGYNFVIDKTPRYWEILDELVDLFPKSKIIILKRNPIDVLKSIIKTWKIDSLEKLHYYKRDFINAPKQIHSFCIRQEKNSNIYSLRYEDLIKDKAKEIKSIYNWIGIDFNESVLETSNNQKYKGKYGDPYQNSSYNDYYELKKKLKFKKQNVNFDFFLKGYAQYLGNNFLKKYGDFDLPNIKTNKTNPFNYFMAIEESNFEEGNLKNEIIKLIKRHYYKYKVLKHFKL